MVYLDKVLRIMCYSYLLEKFNNKKDFVSFMPFLR